MHINKDERQTDLQLQRKSQKEMCCSNTLCQFTDADDDDDDDD